MRVVVAYDISEDNRRARVSAVLAGWGDRIQKSVFECDLDGDELESVVERLSSLINPTTDVVQAFAQCADCHSDRIELGQARQLFDAPYWVL